MTTASWRTPNTVLICGGLILTLAMGIRHDFGLFLQPISADLHWRRETFALALAVQNLVWGATQPFVGMIADKRRWSVTPKGRNQLCDGPTTSSSSVAPEIAMIRSEDEPSPLLI